MISDKIIEDVHREARRQDELFDNENNTITAWIAILGEEFGELCAEALTSSFTGMTPANLRDEAIQVATVALRIVEEYDEGRFG